MTVLNFNETTVALYAELARLLDRSIEELCETVAPSRALALVTYHRREARRRDNARALARLLGVEASVVFSSCTPEGVERLLADFQGPAAPSLRLVAPLPATLVAQCA